MYSSTGDKIRTTLTYIVALVYHVIQSAILERGRFNATKIVLWCNGNTSDFGSEISSSNLGRTTIIDNHGRDINATNRWFGDTVS